jgi:hypothetical protein
LKRSVAIGAVALVIILAVGISALYFSRYFTIANTLTFTTSHNARISGSFTATTGYKPTPTRIDFTSSAGENYSAYAMNIQGNSAGFSIELPDNAVYRVTVVSTTYYGVSTYCNAGTLHVNGNSSAVNIIC